MARSDKPKELCLSEILQSIALLPQMLSALNDQQRQLARLKDQITANIRGNSGDSDGWLDSKGAACYLGISNATFDKYRYKTTPSIKGYPLDGKTLYKKSDLDLFIKLYALKSKGLA